MCVCFNVPDTVKLSECNKLVLEASMTHLSLSVSHFVRLPGASVSPQFQVPSSLFLEVSQSMG